MGEKRERNGRETGEKRERNVKTIHELDDNTKFMNSVKPTPFSIQYRSYFLKDFYLEETVRYTLSMLFEMDELNVMLTGNSNCGKTAMMYAMVREYFGLGPNDAFPQQNFLMINNMQEQGIQYFRTDLKLFCKSLTQIAGKKKIVMIDNIDNLNTCIQQIFCNYIDKYSNVFFFMACSNIQKIIENIQSRVHVLNIQLPTTENMRHHMNKICNDKQISLTPTAQQYLLNISQNNIQSMTSYLEKMYIFRIHLEAPASDLDVGDCEELCNHISLKCITEYILLLKERNLIGAIQKIQFFTNEGFSVIDILDALYCFFKMQSFDQQEINQILTEEIKFKTIELLCRYINLFHTLNEGKIELVMFTHHFYKILQ
jgi:DNA polymerase III delta prime subunit